MTRRTVVVVLAAVSLLVGILNGNGTVLSDQASAVAQTVAAGFAAVPGEKGGQDTFGAYRPVTDWPKPLSQLPDHEKWTWGSTQGVFAESPNRIFILQRGELPAFPRPESRSVPEVGTNLIFPIAGLPFRNATTASPPAAGGTGSLAEDGLRLYKGKFGVDARWEHCLIVVDANGKIIEEWTQWDKMLKRPHAIYISPYDPEKNVWVVDDHSHAIFKFSNDGKRLVQTIGTPGQLGADGTHFNRPTFIAWLPDGTFFVSDGYNGTRVAKFDKNGKFLLDWGEKGNPPKEIRPCYMNNVHGVPGPHRGGFASLAAASVDPPGVIGIVNFAGGRGGRPDTNPGEPCVPNRMENTIETYAKTTKVPVLWHYAENDKYFGPEYPKEWFATFQKAGARGRLVIQPPFGKDGHSIFTSKNGAPIWTKEFDNFIKEIRMN